MNETNNQPAEHFSALPRRTTSNRFGTGWGLTIISCAATLLLSTVEPELLPALTCVTEGELRMPSVVRSVAFSPDGELLAAGSDDGSIALWNAATGRVLGTLTGHEASVRSLRFSADGKELVSAGGSQPLSQAFTCFSIFLEPTIFSPLSRNVCCRAGTRACGCSRRAWTSRFLKSRPPGIRGLTAMLVTGG